jgi:hypothetical protein
MAGVAVVSPQRQSSSTAKLLLLPIQGPCTASELLSSTANWACPSDQRKASSGSSTTALVRHREHPPPCLCKASNETLTGVPLHPLYMSIESLMDKSIL